jgi:hypothetical protein
MSGKKPSSDVNASKMHRKCNYNIMNTTDNIRAAWNEVIPNCLNGLWKKIWQEACTNLEEVQKEMVIQNIVKLANEAGLEGVNEGNVEELLQSHGKSLTHGELQELAEQRMQSEFTASDAEKEMPAREVSTELLSTGTTAITQIMDQFIDNNPDYWKSSKAWQGVLQISCY